MAALHIIPLDGAKPPAKVLALIRERAFKMEVGRIATHGFAADGYDVYMRQMGGAIQAIVRGNSLPYMLNVKIESQLYVWNKDCRYPWSGSPTVPATYRFAHAYALQRGDMRFRLTSPVETEWFEVSPEKIITESGLVPYSENTKGYACLFAGVPQKDATNFTRDDYRNNVYSPNGLVETDDRPTFLYLQAGNDAKCGTTGRSVQTSWPNPFPSRDPAYPYLFGYVQDFEKEGQYANILTIRMQPDSTLKELPKDQQVIRVEIRVSMFQDMDTYNFESVGRSEQYATIVSDLPVVYPTTKEVTITAELFGKPQQEPAIFPVHDGQPFNLSEAERPVPIQAKTQTITLTAEDQPYPEVATHVLTYNHATGEMSLVNA